MGAELLTRWAFRVEAVEDRRQLVVGDAGHLIFDGDQNCPAIVPRAEPDLAERRAEGHGVGNQVAKYLRQPGLDPEYDQRAAAVRQFENEVWGTFCPGRLVEIGERL